LVSQRILRYERRYPGPEAAAGTGVCGVLRLDLGVYLLGAIGAADRSALSAHLSRCTSCRDVLAELAGLPGLLNRVTADDANGLVYHDDGCGAGHEPPADLRLQLLLRRAAQRQRHRMWPRMSAAASVHLIAGAVAALKRYTTAAYWARRAITGKRSGDSS
jgi:predicted anti-sigma-YlaC factor YlaD